MSTILKQQIIELGSQGLSYSRIQEITGASKGTISYHLGNGQKEKTKERQTKRRNSHPMIKKVEAFKSRKTIVYRELNVCKRSTSKHYTKKLMSRKLMTFFMSHEERVLGKLRPMREFSFNAPYVLENKEEICYLTGRKVEFNKRFSYELDHIIPRSRGGDCSFENLGIACVQANQAKRDMTLDEFFQLCIDVVKHNNLKIE